MYSVSFLSKMCDICDIERDSHVTLNLGKIWKEFELWWIQKTHGLKLKNQK